MMRLAVCKVSRTGHTVAEALSSFKSVRGYVGEPSGHSGLVLWAREEICHQFYARDCNNHRPRIKGLHPSCCMIAFMPEELTFHLRVVPEVKEPLRCARRACSEHGALEPWRYLQSFSGASGLFKVYQILSGSRVFSKCSQTGPAGF